MTDVPHGDDWWRANDGKWYPADLRTVRQPRAATKGAPPVLPAAAARQAMAALERETVAPASAPAESPPTNAPDTSAPVATGAGILLELKGSALTSDLDRIGERLEITAEEVRQRGRGNKERGRFAMADIATVEAEKTVKGHWLRITTTDGRELLQQGLESGPAEQARDLIRSHAPLAAQAASAEPTPPPPAVSTPSTVGAIDIPEQIKKLAELHQQGILTDTEFQTKKQELLDRL